MMRGDLLISNAAGDYGKPRPMVVVQADEFNALSLSVIVCPLTSDVRGHVYRVRIAEGGHTGLRRPSEVMTEKIQTLRADRVGEVIGRLDAEDMDAVDRALTLVLGLGKRRGSSRVGG